MPDALKLLTDPLLDELTKRDLQERLTEHSMDESMLGSQARGFVAGALEGVQGMSSPLAIGLMAASPALRGLSAVARAAKGARAAKSAVDAGRAVTAARQAPSMVSQVARRLVEAERSGAGADELANLRQLKAVLEKRSTPPTLPRMFVSKGVQAQPAPTATETEALIEALKQRLKNVPSSNFDDATDLLSR